MYTLLDTHFLLNLCTPRVKLVDSMRDHCCKHDHTLPCSKGTSVETPTFKSTTFFVFIPTRPYVLLERCELPPDVVYARPCVTDYQFTLFCMSV